MGITEGTAPQTNPCSNGTCVDVEVTFEGFDFVSTLGADKGRVSYTPAEVAAFLTDVKAGKHDDLIELAKERTAINARTEEYLATL
jgi:hypothetical protein